MAEIDRNCWPYLNKILLLNFFCMYPTTNRLIALWLGHLINAQFCPIGANQKQYILGFYTLKKKKKKIAAIMFLSDNRYDDILKWYCISIVHTVLMMCSSIENNSLI